MPEVNTNRHACVVKVVGDCHCHVQLSGEIFTKISFPLPFIPPPQLIIVCFSSSIHLPKDSAQWSDGPGLHVKSGQIDVFLDWQLPPGSNPEAFSISTQHDPTQI